MVTEPIKSTIVSDGNGANNILSDGNGANKIQYIV